VDGLFIKKNVDLYITGSNARLLSGELATLLTGRYIETEILPFSFAEYMDATAKFAKLAKNESLANFGDSLTTELQSSTPNLSKSESLAHFIYHGGIPQSISFMPSNLTQTNRFVQGILATILEKDVFKRHTKTDKQAFGKVFDFVLDTIGSYISPRSIADTLTSNGMAVDKAAVGRYLFYLTEAFLLYKVPRYDVKGKGLLQTLDKYYLADPAFRKVRLGKKFSDDRGHLLENAVYLELRRRNREVYVGKLRDKEIDFVAVDHSGYVSYYQVAWSILDPATLERELAPLRAIRDSNPKYLLSTDLDVNPVYDGIRKLNVADWLFGEMQNG
jgi:predicted AAA+ superfamily ATPase